MLINQWFITYHAKICLAFFGQQSVTSHTLTLAMISVAPNLTRAEPFAYSRHESKITWIHIAFQKKEREKGTRVRLNKQKPRKPTCGMTPVSTESARNCSRLRPSVRMSCAMPPRMKCFSPSDSPTIVLDAAGQKPAQPVSEALRRTPYPLLPKQYVGEMEGE